MSKKLIVRTSDTNKFRDCRVAWDFGSKVRMNYQYTPGIEALDFGSAIHEGMEVKYDPARWGSPPDLVLAEMQLAFFDWMKAWRSRLRKTGNWDLQKERWAELKNMGYGMLDHYQLWSATEDEDWEPIRAEIEFEVPVPAPPWEFIRQGFAPNREGQLCFVNKYAQHIPIVLQGRIDAIMRKKSTGQLWLWDHKTAAAFQERTDYLDLDPQAGRYVYAARHLNLDVQGVVFNQLRKKAPEPPKELKDGSLSMNKAQNTTPEIYMRRVRELGLDEAYYQNWLTDTFVGQVYFRRVETHRSFDETDMLGIEIACEAQDMFGDPLIYRNPGGWRCNNCEFRQVCQTRFDGGDWKYLLESSGMFTKRDAPASA